MTFTTSTPFFLLLLFLFSVGLMPSFVLGHGYVNNVTIAGKTYTGWNPNTMPYTAPIGKSIVRNVPDDGPVLDTTSSALACNEGGEKAAALIANANAGDLVKLTMNTWPADHVGPVTVYMANCNGDCMSFNPSKGKVWFKVDQDGMTKGVWGTLKLISQGNSWSVKIPPTIKAGQYLLRFEILALHSAGEPQFYPSCTQLNIKSSGSSVPSSSDLVAIPGIYANAGKAIYGSVWNGTPTSWPVAGPAVVSWATSGTGSGTGGKGQTTSTSKTATQPSQSKITTTTALANTRLAKTATETTVVSAPKNIIPPVSVAGAGTEPSTSSAAAPTTSSAHKRCRNKKRSASPGLVGADTQPIKIRPAKRNDPDLEERESRSDVYVQAPREDAPSAEPIVVYERARRHASVHHASHNMLKNKRGATGMRVRHA